ncbi:hypothetical protein [Streptomyces sp. NPDC002057]|uniref:hypothetical protein n=1 Tax=Streptomyces sp. NPDC002057 TaxID=3154664 RepID=UPI0033257F0B
MAEVLIGWSVDRLGDRSAARWLGDAAAAAGAAAHSVAKIPWLRDVRVDKIIAMKTYSAIRSGVPSAQGEC